MQIDAGKDVQLLSRQFDRLKSSIFGKDKSETDREGTRQRESQHKQKSWTWRGHTTEQTGIENRLLRTAFFVKNRSDPVAV